MIFCIKVMCVLNPEPSNGCGASERHPLRISVHGPEPDDEVNWLVPEFWSTALCVFLILKTLMVVGQATAMNTLASAPVFSSLLSSSW